MKKLFTLSLLISLALAGCVCCPPSQHGGNKLVEIARSDRQWTGIAVTPEGRIFVNYPRWSAVVPVSVGELRPDGTVLPYPDAEYNIWEDRRDPATHFVCVQSVVADRDGFLWILDPANPQFKGVVPGGPKLLKVDTAKGGIVQTIRFAPPLVESDSYLNDVRVDTRRNTAYITDSGAGAIVVVDLATGVARRLLAHHPSTQSEKVSLTIEGKPWRRPDGSVPSVNADGIALDPAGDYLYYQALTGRTLYRIETRWLRDPRLSERELGEKVETVGKTGAADGIEFGPDGRLYLTALEENAIKSLRPGEEARIVAQSPKLVWPDSLSFGPDGGLYLTTSQINRGPDPKEPYRIFKLEKRP